jgi:hypothetical protein
MRPPPRPAPLAAVAAALFAAVGGIAALAAADDGAPAGCPAGSVPSVDLAPPALLSSPLHRIGPCTTIDGHMARFVLETRWGEIEAVGLAALEARVEELAVLEALDGVTVAGEGARAAGSAIATTAGTVARVVTSPVESLRRLPQGAVDYVGRTLGELGEDARRIGDEAYDAVTGRGAAEASSVRPGAEAGAARDDAEPWWQRGGREVGRLARRWIGWEAARRRVAERHGVDPYTSNPPLAERLDALAWAATTGERAVGFGIGQAGPAAGAVIGGTRRINRIVWEESPANVARWNRERLDAAGCDPAETRRFVRNGAFSPTIQTALVDAFLELAPGAGGCEALLTAADAVQDDVDARFLAGALGLAVDEIARRRGGGYAATTEDPGNARPTLTLAGLTPVFQLADGTRLLALPVDRLEWTPATHAFFDRETFRVRDKTLLLRGQASPRALSELTRRGWEIAEVR